ncbi:MAG: hypothetical protein AB7V27_19965 [Candidatus Binatia bacterium]
MTPCRLQLSPWSILCAGSLATMALLCCERVLAREAGDPIALEYTEGDVAGYTRILSPDGRQTIGTIEYQQRRRGSALKTVRRARFSDGSSDEDHAEARVGKTLEAVRGRSIIRNARGQAIVDITIDVERGRITGFTNVDDERKDYDEEAELPRGTYWGPLISIVLKNFDRNAEGGELVYRTVVATPKPRVLDMIFTRDGVVEIDRPGVRLEATRYSLKPTVNFLIDPIIQRLAPDTFFFVHESEPPAIVRFAGPRNFAGQEIWIE